MVESKGSCVVYVMSRDQRVKDNHALLIAQKHALAKGLPLAVVFVLQTKSSYRAREHFEFMLEGLRQVESDLKDLNIPFIMMIGDPRERILGFIHHTNPDAVYFDLNPLNGPKDTLNKLSKSSGCSIYVVDTHNCVPVWVTSDKQEVAAYTIRPKIHRLLEEFLVEPEQLVTHPYSWSGEVQLIEKLARIIDPVLNSIPSNHTKISYESGERYGAKQLEDFIINRLNKYSVDRNNPTLDGQSDLSPYLHFGQISSLRVALRLREESLKNGSDLHLLKSPKMPKPETADGSYQYGIDALLEEMIVRKELADNFCYYNPNYISITGAPSWAIKSLDNHSTDNREYQYNFEQLRDAKTHDTAWNAAQLQLTKTGKIHGYMRMYWAKKVFEWSPVITSNDSIEHSNIQKTIIDDSCGVELQEKIEIFINFRNKIEKLSGAEWAIEVLKYLNDHYSIDGGDPNGYAGIMWSICGVQDRPWIERQVFGSIRYMNYQGLKRKFDIQSYENQWL